MSVLQCSRQDCRAISCERYSHHYGYICEECFEELCITNPDSLYEWMSEPKEHGYNHLNVQLYYEDIFQLRGTS